MKSAWGCLIPIIADLKPFTFLPKAPSDSCNQLCSFPDERTDINQNMYKLCAGSEPKHWQSQPENSNVGALHWRTQFCRFYLIAWYHALLQFPSSMQPLIKYVTILQVKSVAQDLNIKTMIYTLLETLKKSNFRESKKKLRKLWKGLWSQSYRL